MNGRPDLNYPNWMDIAHWSYFSLDHFDKLPAAGTGGAWTPAGATITRHASIGAPILCLGATDTNNSAGGIKRTNAALQFRDDAPFVHRTRMLFTEAVSSGVANGFVGVSDQAIGSILGDDGAGPAASHDGAGFYWKDGSTQLYVWAGNGTTIFNEALSATNRNNLTQTSILASSANIRDWQVWSKPTRTGYTEIQWLLNGQLVASYEMVTATAAMMGSAILGKSGDATNEQTIRIYSSMEAQNYATLVGTSLA
jgi:hypothetical protein